MSSFFPSHCANLRRNFTNQALRALILVPAIFCWFTAPVQTSAANPKKPKPAKLKVSGYGLVGNFELKRILKTLELGRTKPEFFSASFIEDSALLLGARIRRDGYLKPTIHVHLLLSDGATREVEATDLTENPLPEALKIRRAHFTIHKGVLYYYERIQFSGLSPLTEKQARAYFVEMGSLLPLKARRIYTPEKLQSGLANLTEALKRKGYEKATAASQDLEANDHTGKVTVRIIGHTGEQTIVHSVRREFIYDGVPKPEEQKTDYPHAPYSKIWLQDYTQGLKTNRYHLGYPDTSVETQTLRREAVEGHIELDLLMKVNCGSLIHIGGVEFQGQVKTRPSLLSRRVRVKRGELLDRIKVEEGRYRLAQLGAFESVDLAYKEMDDHMRGVLYAVKEAKKLDFSLLFGFGSYELLRGGIEMEAHNLWGLGHEARIKAVQSFKSSSGEFTYTFPEFSGHDIDTFINASGLRREEVSFTREEYGGGFGGHKFFNSSATDLRIRYNYEILNAANTYGYDATEGRTNAAVGAIITDLKHDRRDNALYPTKGYKVFANLELATEYLGGDVNYERLEISSAWHRPLGGGRVLSFGVSHGFVAANGNTAENLPFNRRFFPGGANSIRGYTEGRASPRNEAGQIVGAESYVLGTVEFEQALTPRWAVVAFSDSIGIARKIANYPFDTGLFSIGAGLRWKTVVGPIRLEYGYNLNPRRDDPTGAIQFSLGFPF